MTDFDQQAADFLQSTGTTLNKVLLGKQKYFPDDTESRNVWRITMKRKHMSYSFTFGDSIENTEQGQEPPTDYDILASLDPHLSWDNVDDMAKDLGITKPSHAFKVWGEMQNQAKQLQTLFNEEELQRLSEIV